MPEFLSLARTVNLTAPFAAVTRTPCTVTLSVEVLVEAPESIAEQVCELVREAMIEAMAALFPQVPIEVEAGVCAHWGEK